MKLPERCRDALVTHLDPDLFKALCDPKRLALLTRLAVAEEPMTVSQIATSSDVHLSGVSRHLHLLRQAGVLTADKDGREVRYQLNGQVLIGALRGLADALEDCCTAVGCCGFKKKEQP